MQGLGGTGCGYLGSNRRLGTTKGPTFLLEVGLGSHLGGAEALWAGCELPPHWTCLFTPRDPHRGQRQGSGGCHLGTETRKSRPLTVCPAGQHGAWADARAEESGAWCTTQAFLSPPLHPPPGSPPPSPPYRSSHRLQNRGNRNWSPRFLLPPARLPPREGLQGPGAAAGTPGGLGCLDPALEGLGPPPRAYGTLGLRVTDPAGQVAATSRPIST